jgi:hypothetical protein
MKFSSSSVQADRGTGADMFSEFLRLLALGVVHGIGLGCQAVTDRQYQRIQEDAAVDAITRNYRARADLLQERNNLAKLEEEARALGVDLDKFEQEYHDTRDGLNHVGQTRPHRRTLDQ